MRLWRAGAVIAEVGGVDASTASRRRSPGGTATCGWSRSSSTRPRRPDRPRLRGPRWRAGHRQVAPRVGVREVRRRPYDERLVAPRTLPVLRRRRRVLGAGRGRPRTTRPRRVRHRRASWASASSTGLADVVADDEERDLAAPAARRAPGARRPQRRSPREGRPLRGVDGVPRAGERRRRPPSSSCSTTPSTPTTGLLDFLDHLLGTAPRPASSSSRLARPELLARRPDLGGRRTTVVRLDPLDDAAMARADRRSRRGPVAARHARCLVERAEGVPLFAVETVRALIDRDAVVPRDGRYVAPAEVRASTSTPSGRRRRCRHSSPPDWTRSAPVERRVVADASVLGRRSPATDLAPIDRRRSRRTSTTCWRRCSARRSSASSRTDSPQNAASTRFVQSVVRQVAYATQSKRDRKAAASRQPSDLEGRAGRERRLARRRGPAPARRRGRHRPPSDDDADDLTARARDAARARGQRSPSRWARPLEALAALPTPASRRALIDPADLEGRLRAGGCTDGRDVRRLPGAGRPRCRRARPADALGDVDRAQDVAVSESGLNPSRLPRSGR